MSGVLDVHVDPLAVIDPTAVLYPGSRVGPHTIIGRGCIVGSPDGPATDIGPEVSLGPNTVVAPGVRIGRGARIQPVSYVERDVPPYSIVGGNPARITGYCTNSPVDAPVIAPADPGVARTLSVRGATLRPFRSALDLRGALVAGEHPQDVPFEVARFFLVYDVPGEHLRGEHAHRECHQLLVAVHGALTVVLDDGTSREQVRLDSPTMGLHMEPGTWAVQYGYSADAVLLVLASHVYDPEDYIRDYDEFQEFVAPRIAAAPVPRRRSTDQPTTRG